MLHIYHNVDVFICVHTVATAARCTHCFLSCFFATVDFLFWSFEQKHVLCVELSQQGSKFLLIQKTLFGSQILCLFLIILPETFKYTKNLSHKSCEQAHL